MSKIRAIAPEAIANTAKNPTVPGLKYVFAGSTDGDGVAARIAENRMSML
jgi:hypothetical protein